MKKNITLSLLMIVLALSCGPSDDSGESVIAIIGPSDIQYFDINSRNKA